MSRFFGPGQQHKREGLMLVTYDVYGNFLFQSKDIGNGIMQHFDYSGNSLGYTNRYQEECDASGNPIF